MIHFNCGKNWSSFNILNPKVQQMLFSRINSSTLLNNPFSSNHFVTPLYLQVFKSSLKIYNRPNLCYSSNCNKKDEKWNRNFVTYVFQIKNNNFLSLNTVAQLTISLNQKAGK